MKLSRESIDAILKAVVKFDRERGIPHNYVDLEKALEAMDFHSADGVVEPGAEVEEPKVLTSRGDT